MANEFLFRNKYDKYISLNFDKYENILSFLFTI